jgi:hypothetical protein
LDTAEKFKFEALSNYLSLPLLLCYSMPAQYYYTMPKIGSQFEKKIESTRAIVTKEENSFAF